ncbi:MAG: hypothetical protein IJ390_05570 [Lachnospiraceae bacterium]|nr:hypothetical protein [Lachnospiraceae bacterium]
MKKDVILPLLTAAVIGLFCIADIFTQDRVFSEQENRKLSQKPEFSMEKLLDGTFAEEYEAYVTDQMPGRNAFIFIKTAVQKLSGQKEVNGVYFAKDNTLIMRNAPESVDTKKADAKAGRMLQQAKEILAMTEGHVGLMLVPAADGVQTQRLPAFSVDFDQLSWIENVEKQAEEAGMTVVDADSALLLHADEEIYYGSDHHWTTLGAFYGYQEFAEKFQLSAVSLEDYEKTAVLDTFWGTLQAKVNLPVRQDTIEIFKRQDETLHRTVFVYEGKEADSCYFSGRLRTKDAYSYFLDGNYPLVEIEGDGPQDKTILLIKDSYANCFAPFLTRDYGTIRLVDRRYYRGDVVELVQKYEPTDVLYLYQVFQFIENF